MEKEATNLTLPEFGFISGYKRQSDELYGRNIIWHFKSSSVLEVLESEDIVIENMLVLPFTRLNHLIECVTGNECEERFVMILHSSPLFDINKDKEHIIKHIMKPAAMWFCDYCTYIDNSITKEDLYDL